jgi:GNAT superfamily N-acetyltransferase
MVTAQATLYRNIVGGSFELMPNWGRGFSGLQVPIFNIFLPLKPAGLNDDTLADTSAFFSSRNVLYAIELIHDFIPKGPDYLTQLDYQPLPPQPAMVLSEPPGTVRTNPDIAIERVATVPSLTAFSTILHSVFDFSMHDTLKRFPVSHLREDRIRHYLAFLDEEPVGAGTVVCANGVCSVWNVCTIDQHRRRGVAATLLSQMLADARQNGHTLSMLFSTAHAYKFFGKLGFEIYTQRQWFLPPGISYEEEEGDKS